jgi:hypothetical protein
MAAYWYFAHSKGKYGNRELLVDLDQYTRQAPSKTGANRGPWGEIFFRRRLQDAIRAGLLDVSRVFLDRSNTHGNFHAFVLLKKPMPVIERMVWQLRLGSDLMRCQADLMRAVRGVEYPSLLIRSRTVTDFYRPPDRECECVTKHSTDEQQKLGKDGCPVWQSVRGMSPWELFGAPDTALQKFIALPLGEVPLDLILRVEKQDDGETF